MKVIKVLLLAISAVLSFQFISCVKEETAEEPYVEIMILSATSQSVTFSFVAHDAVSVSYSVCKASEMQVPESSWIESDALSAENVTIEGLEENTEYSVSAYAVNAAGLKSQIVRKEVITTSSPLVYLTVEYCGTRSVEFMVTTVNADSYGFAVVPPSEVENTVLEMNQKATEGTHIVEDLEPNTLYSVIAQAGNSAGELSAIILEPARTEAEATVTVGRIETDEAFAVAYMQTNGDAARFYYALTAQGVAPEDSEFKEESASEKEVPLYFYELETGGRYTLWAYAQNKKGFSGEMVSSDFTVDVSDNPDFKVRVSDITSFNAQLDIRWDPEKYSGAYWTVQNSIAIPDPASFDWNTGLAYGVVVQLVSPGSYTMGDYFYIEQDADKQRAGVLFLGKDGVEDVAVWRDITLKEVEFGESECSLDLELVVSAYSTITYTVSAESGCTGYYFGYTASETDVESYTKSLVSTFRQDVFDTEIMLQSLTPETHYRLVAIPVDDNGLLGNYKVLEVLTPAAATVTESEVQAALASKSYTSLTYDIRLDPETSYAQYYTFTDEEYTTDKDIFDALVSSSYSRIYSSGQTSFTSTASGYMQNDRVYNTWIIPVDRYGQLGKITKLCDKTEKIVIDGQGSVTIVLDEYTEQQFGAQAKISIIPDEGLTGYYYKSADFSQVNGLSNEQIVELFFNNPYTAPEFRTETCQLAGWDGNGEYVYDGYRLLVLPVDGESRLCTPVVYEIIGQ